AKATHLPYDLAAEARQPAGARPLADPVGKFVAAVPGRQQAADAKPEELPQHGDAAFKRTAAFDDEQETDLVVAEVGDVVTGAQDLDLGCRLDRVQGDVHGGERAPERQVGAACMAS